MWGLNSRRNLVTTVGWTEKLTEERYNFITLRWNGVENVQFLRYVIDGWRLIFDNKISGLLHSREDIRKKGQTKGPIPNQDHTSLRIIRKVLILVAP